MIWRAARNRSRASGWTLLELVFVAAALIVVSAAALPSWRGAWTALQAERAARAVAQQWRLARTLAIARGAQIEWRWRVEAHDTCLVAPDGEVPSFDNAQDGALSAVEGAPLEPRWAMPQVLPAGVQLRLSDAARLEGRIRFFPDGTSGDAEGAMPAITAVVGGTASTDYHVTLDGATGAVVVEPAAHGDQQVSDTF